MRDRIFGPVRSFRVLFGTKQRERREYGSILLIHKALSKNVEPFLERVCQALDLIKHTDPRAWRMIEREIRYIVNELSLSSGDYFHWSRVLIINFEDFFVNDDPDASEEETREWYVASTAATIILGATLGRIESWGIPHNKATRERIDRVCVMRIRRFLARLHSDDYDLMELVPPLEPGGWASYWTPERRRERTKEMRAHYLPQIRALWRK